MYIYSVVYKIVIIIIITTNNAVSYSEKEFHQSRSHHMQLLSLVFLTKNLTYSLAYLYPFTTFLTLSLQHIHSQFDLLGFVIALQTLFCQLFMACTTSSALANSILLPNTSKYLALKPPTPPFYYKGFVSKRKVDLTITNVATPLRPTAPSLDNINESTGERINFNHVAWTSVRQERWEGELVVQGTIPLWLVRQTNIYIYIYIYY